MAQWGRPKHFVYNGCGYAVLPHFDTGEVVFHHVGSSIDPSAKIDYITMTFCGGETDVAERLTEYCRGMTVDQWRDCDPKAILDGPPASEVAAYTATPSQTVTASNVRIIDPPELYYHNAFVDILINADNPEEVRRIAAAALKGERL